MTVAKYGLSAAVIQSASTFRRSSDGAKAVAMAPSDFAGMVAVAFLLTFGPRSAPTFHTTASAPPGSGFNATPENIPASAQ